MDKLLEINKHKPKGSELLIRTDLGVNDWFVHFYYEEYTDEKGWRKSETLLKGFYSNDEIENVLDKILKMCIEFQEIKKFF